MKAFTFLSSLLLCAPVLVMAFESLDNQSLVRALEADQASRSQENIAQGNFPKLADEINRRLLVFAALSRGELVTANDFYNAAIILQHTNLEYVGDTLRSMGNENHLLAHFLARRAHELKHPNTNWLLVATYNRYLENSAHDFDRYALELDGEIIKARHERVTDEDRTAVGLIPVSEIIGEL
ncbi:hypothetical protein FM042_03400 [Aliidiomarina halalkaliphila]|uniref:MxaK protein n=1 Tax=Aliidiomarina halalkaliphila TaxID=2593535 RepID=A0A552X4Q5_9GAMM|nr:hypothetical protein [Aliidiomarina halalkaliphila]TRW49909.1 hypothetical protein FM042_03400 [Aliidiomarina halalkaliphila]